MDDTLLALLKRVDSPTVCNAIEVAQGKRGFAGFTRGTVLCSAPGEVMVGYAVTSKLAAQEPPRDDPATIRARRMAYYRAFWDAPKPCIAVIEDLDDTPVGAFWGEVNTTLHKALGVVGALTNGVMRDLGDLASDFPVVAGSIGPSHGFVHLREIGTPVTVFGLTIAPGDLVHADRHGAVVIPPEVVPQLATSIEKLWASEKVILDPSRQGFRAWEEFEAAWAAFEAART